MNETEQYRHAIGRLQSIQAVLEKDAELKEIVDAKEQVFAHYQPVFAPDGIDQLSAQVFRDFLLFRNNCHWIGLQRMGPAITADLDVLKKAVHELLSEDIPIAERLNRLLPSGRARVKKLGKAVLTAILLVVYPDSYGVWNNITESAMKELAIWPVFERGASIGDRYKQVNAIMHRVTADLGVDLWTLDALWWRVVRPLGELLVDDDEIVGDSAQVRFGLERHLHDFLLDNWEHTSIGQDWDLVEDGGDIKGYGYERPTPIGKIDLLARHKSAARWLVIELKRAQTSDDTVGQVLRYMGWVMEELATEEEEVEGLIIAYADDKKLDFALKATPRVKFMRYEVDFKLVEETS